MQPTAAETPTRPTKLGVLLRVGIFAFNEIVFLQLLAWVMLPVGGYLVAAALSTFGAAALANALALRIYERGQLPDVGLHWTAASRWNLLLGLAGGIGAALLVTALPLVLGHAVLQRAEDWESGGLGSVLFVSIVLLFGAIGEELLFRGYGFQVLLNHMGTYATLLPVSVLFGLAHSNNQNASTLGMVNTVAWGLLFGLAFMRSRDLWLPIGIHYGWNFTLPLFGVNLSGFTMNVTGYAIEWRIPENWSGGAYGPEAGLLCTFALALLFYGLYKAPVRRQVSLLYNPPDDEPIDEELEV